MDSGTSHFQGFLLFKLVRKEKGPFTEVEEHMPPIFVVQVLDSDSPSQDDFLGMLRSSHTQLLYLVIEMRTLTKRIIKRL